jgi:hypothetical protein
MKVSLVAFFLCLMTLCSFSQDTLFFKNASTLVVIVREVSPTEVQYKKFEMPDGPMYIVGRNDLEKIVYKNGIVESLKPAAVNTVNEQQSPEPIPSPVYIEKIEYRDTKRKPSSLINMALGYPDLKKKNDLLNVATDIRRLKIHQDGTRGGAIIFGGFAIAGGVIYLAAYTLSGSSNGVEVFAIPPIVFGVAGVILGSASIAININLRHKRHEFVRIYNE